MRNWLDTSTLDVGSFRRGGFEVRFFLILVPRPLTLGTNGFTGVLEC